MTPMAFSQRIRAPRPTTSFFSRPRAVYSRARWSQSHCRPQLVCYVQSEDNTTQIEELQVALNDAVEREDYAAAAALKEELEQAIGSNLLASLEKQVATIEKQLDAAVKREDYQEAAVLRDKLKNLKQQHLSNVSSKLSQLQTSSNTLSNEVRVTVQSAYVPQQSFPDKGMFFFHYHVKIENESDRSDRIVKVQNRHWKITNGWGKIEHVRGAGVVGKQPVLAPGEVFEYASGCMLPTPIGSMEGEYDMLVLDANKEPVTVITVKIGCFGLQAPAADAGGSALML